jgi:hypothetical protein
MLRENMEVGEPVRRLWAALGKHDWDGFSAELDPEMEYTPHVATSGRAAARPGRRRESKSTRSVR